MKMGIVIYSNDSEIVWNALRFANFAVKEGDVVKVFSAKGQFLATGHFHDGSIKVRIISFEDVHINADFWSLKLQNAYRLRKSLGFEDNRLTNAYRLIHAEGDCAPGLIVKGEARLFR